MGCTQSTHVVESKRIVQAQIVQKKVHEQIQIKKTIIKDIPERGQCFLIGSLNEKENIFGNVILQTMTINKMSLPSGGFECNNFSSILQIQKGKYIISGGINHDLTKISNQCYFYYSLEHRVQKIEPMKQPRYTHVSIYSDKSNYIYAIGGRYYGDDSKAILSHCQKYSIKQNKWVDLPSMNVKRCTSLVFSWNCTIYVLGGYTGPFQRSTKIEYLNHQQTQWVLLDINLNRGLQGAIVLPTNNNEITIFGGLCNSGPTDSVITINLKEKSIKSQIKLLQKRSLYKSFYKNGKVYIFGGDDAFTSQVYDIVDQSSKLIKKQYPFSLQDFDSLGFSTASVNVLYSEESGKGKKINLQDQIVYILGTTQEPFLCQLNISIPYATFHAIPLDIKLYAYQGGVLMGNGSLILFGGIQDDSLSVISSDTYSYNLKSNQSSKLAKMNQNRYAFAFQKCRNSKHQTQCIYCLGGATSNAQGQLVFLSACQRYLIHQNKWELITPLPQKLISPMSLVFKQSLFVFGGTNDKNQKINSIFMYHQNQDFWTTLESKLLFGLQASALAKVSQNQFYLFGGRVENGQSSGIWSLYFNETVENKNKQVMCVFQQKGKINQKKSLHKVYQPKHQSFYVIFGGESHPLSFYKKNLDEQTSDLLLNVRQVFAQTLQRMNHKNLKGYLILSQQSY